MWVHGMCFLSYNHWEKYKISEGEVIYCGALENSSGALFIPPSVITHENIMHIVQHLPRNQMLLIPIWLWGLLWSLTLGFERQPPQVYEGPPVSRGELNSSGLKPAPVSTGKANSPEMCSVTHTCPVGNVGCADYLRWTLKEFRVVSCCVWHPAARVSIVLVGILPSKPAGSAPGTEPCITTAQCSPHTGTWAVQVKVIIHLTWVA